MAFIRWRKARGYEVIPFKRQFWGKTLWLAPKQRKKRGRGYGN
jgi:hypothetical protein